ncbi:hypothetical protein [Pseudomonas sp.]|uniref:hypothetical protein n=1 Tax=Pseudomonas sp. TaxID=306 RepID=UPI003FD754FE
MNSLVRSIATLTLSGFLGMGMTSMAHSQTASAPMDRDLMLADASSPGMLENSKNNPYNSPIRRANPNSRQGTESSTPPVRGPNTVPNPRPPTLENGGIRNGYPTRQQPSGGATKIQRGDLN